MAARKPRIVFDLVPNSYVFDTGNRMEPRWLLKQRDRSMLIDSDKRKGQLAARAAERCRKIEAEGGRAQLVIHGKDGKIQTEHTYGEDPRRTKG